MPKKEGRLWLSKVFTVGDVKGWRGRGNEDGNAWARERRSVTHRGEVAIDTGYGDIFIYNTALRVVR